MAPNGAKHMNKNMKKIVFAAALIGCIATPTMARDRNVTDPAAKAAQHQERENQKDARRCNKALEEYLKNGTGYQQVLQYCGL